MGMISCFSSHKVKALYHYSGQEYHLYIAAVVKRWMSTICSFFFWLPTALVLRRVMQLIGHQMVPLTCHTSALWILQPSPSSMLVFLNTLHSFCIMYKQSASSRFTVVAAETPLHSWSQCWSCWSGFEMVQLWLILWIPLALHRQVVLTQIELQSLEGKEEVGGQTMRVGCRKKTECWAL